MPLGLFAIALDLAVVDQLDGVAGLRFRVSGSCCNCAPLNP